LRSGKKYSVKVPDGCLLIQAGKQIEHITGGYVQAGLNSPPLLVFHLIVLTG